MVIETPNWNRDKFGDNIEETKNYYGRRESHKYQPIEGESLDGYARRLQGIIHQLETINTSAHIYGRKMWFTHKTPSECWICEEINVMWYLQDILQMVSNITETMAFRKDDHGKLVLQKVD